MTWQDPGGKPIHNDRSGYGLNFRVVKCLDLQSTLCEIQTLMSHRRPEEPLVASLLEAALAACLFFSKYTQIRLSHYTKDAGDPIATLLGCRAESEGGPKGCGQTRHLETKFCSLSNKWVYLLYRVRVSSCVCRYRREANLS